MGRDGHASLQGCRRRSSGGWVERRLVKSVSCVQSLYLVSRLGENVSSFIGPQGQSIHSVPS